MVTVASLFDGIGGTPLCARMAGATCLWASEIEKFPIEVTKYHFPEMVHYGDITKINGADVPTVDIIVGGSPCQDLSVAGKRKGLKHSELGDDEGTRSGLFMEQVRIVKEMREHARATDQPIRPRYVMWENVPGAFSSNHGEDFRAVIEEFAKIADEAVSIPKPPNGKWLNAGCIMGKSFSIAWRVSDAQYGGVAQRRRRIYLVVDLGGQSAPEILFEREGVPGDSAASCCAWKGTPGDAQGCTGSAGGVTTAGFNGHKSITGNICYNYEKTPSIETKMPPNVVQVYENHGQDSRITGPLDVSPTVSRKYETGGNNVPLVARMQSFDGEYAIDGTASALKARDHKDATDLVIAAVDCRNFRETEAFGTLQAKENGGQSLNYSGAVRIKRLVRRFTPLECERLQGYPDHWTDIPGASDTARYKALGNSFAIPNAYFAISRCVKELEATHDTLTNDR